MNPAQLLAHFDRIAEAPDAVPRLRRFVLDLAVRGELVEQDTAEDPAAELLNRIEVEPSQFEIPENWVSARAGQLLNIQYGKALPAKDRSDQGSVAVFGSNGIVGYCETALAKEPAIVIGRKGSAGALNICDGPSWTTDVAYFLIPPSLFSIRFLFVVLRTLDLASLGKGVKPGLSRADAYQLPVVVPPLAEQHRIVAKVDELMALCDELEAAQAKREKRRDRLVAATLHGLNNGDVFEASARFTFQHLPHLTTRPEHIHQLRQTIRNLAVRGKLIRQLETDIQHYSGRSVPESGNSDRLDIRLPPQWKWVRADDVAHCRLGKMLDKNKNSGNPYKYLRNTNVHWFQIRMSELKCLRLEESEVAEYSLINGDVLICEGGHGIGRAAVWRHKDTQIVFQKALHRVRPGADLDGDFFALCIYVYFHSGVLQNYFTGVGIPHLTGRALAQLVFPLPPLAEQHRIVAKVDELMALCDALEAQLTTTATTSHQLLEATLHEALAQ